MSKKYHINAKNEPSECRAETAESCPLGGFHGDQSAVVAEIERKNAEEHGGNFTNGGDIRLTTAVTEQNEPEYTEIPGQEYRRTFRVINQFASAEDKSPRLANEILGENSFSDWKTGVYDDAVVSIDENRREVLIVSDHYSVSLDYTNGKVAGLKPYAYISSVSQDPFYEKVRSLRADGSEKFFNTLDEVVKDEKAQDIIERVDNGVCLSFGGDKIFYLDGGERVVVVNPGLRNKREFLR